MLVHVLVLVLEICRNEVQSIVYNIIFCYYFKWSQSLTTKNSTFTDSNCSLLPGLPTFSKRFRNRRSHTGASCLINLIRACISVLLNTAEGNGKRQGLRTARFFNEARGSALECAACLDASVAKRITKSDLIGPGKELLARIVAMLARLVVRFDPYEFRIREDGINA